MRRRLATAVLVGWLLGVASLAGFLAIMGDGYEYRWFVLDLDQMGAERWVRCINERGWQFVPGVSRDVGGDLYLRRPRIMGWFNGPGC